MRSGLTVSLLLHVVILVWGLVSFATPRKVVTPKITPISVSFVTAADLDKIRKGARDSKLKTAAAKLKKKPLKAKKKKSKPKPKLAAAKPTVEPPKPKAKPKPKPKPKVKPKTKAPALKPTIDPVAKKLAELAKKPKPKPKVKPKPKPKPKAKLKPKPKKIVRKRRKKKKKTYTDRMTALLNKIPDRSAPRAASKPKTQRKKRVGPRAGAFDGRAEQLAINQIAGVMQAKMRECWRLPTGGVGADQMIVTVRVRLRRDGLLAAYPEVQNTSSLPFFRIAAESVKRALKACEPYDLPPDKYDIWRDMDLDFDPSAMYGL